MRLWKKIRDLKERMHFKTSFVIELSIIIGCFVYLLIYVLCLMQADNTSHYWKVCYDLCINIGAATALTFMFEDISIRVSRRQQALAILQMNSFLQDYISNPPYDLPRKEPQYVLKPHPLSPASFQERVCKDENGYPLLRM